MEPRKHRIRIEPERLLPIKRDLQVTGPGSLFCGKSVANIPPNDRNFKTNLLSDVRYQVRLPKQVVRIANAITNVALLAGIPRPPYTRRNALVIETVGYRSG